MSNSMREPALAKQIIRYFLRHPQALDTSEGLARWRLFEEEFRRVQQALGWLVDRKLLLRIVKSASPPLFCLNSDKASEARQFVRAPGKREGAGRENGSGD